jgi:hypothetical protein
MDDKAKAYCRRHPEIREVNIAICKMWDRRAARFVFRSDGAETVVDDGTDDLLRIGLSYERIKRRLLRQSMHTRLWTFLRGTKVQCGTFYCRVEGTEICLGIVARENEAECMVFVPLGWKENGIAQPPPPT